VQKPSHTSTEQPKTDETCVQEAEYVKKQAKVEAENRASSIKIVISLRYPGNNKTKKQKQAIPKLRERSQRLSTEVPLKKPSRRPQDARRRLPKLRKEAKASRQIP
jgi:hypothetical protein